tara:strand:- start:356 stop:499 length:144 start_codon:yes stop_codon:yes gene_type:complete
MKKHYKVKEKNITKLKEYLKDGNKSSSKRSGECTSDKHNRSKRSNIQ